MKINTTKAGGGLSLIEDSPQTTPRNSTEALVVGLLNGEQRIHAGAIKNQCWLAATPMPTPVLRADSCVPGTPAPMRFSTLSKHWQCVSQKNDKPEVGSSAEGLLPCASHKQGISEFGPSVDELLLLKRHAPSYNFFRQRDFKIQIWEDQHLRALPLADIFRTEAAHLHTHAPLYHATRQGIWALNHLVTRIIKAANPEIDLGTHFWLRNPADTRLKLPRLPTVGEMRGHLESVGMYLAEGIDNRSTLSHMFLSCNPSIMQNSDVHSDESSADFYLDKKSVNSLDSPSNIETVLSALNPDIARTEIKQLAATVASAIKDELKSDRGVLYQFLIPVQRVNDLTYICGPNGVPNEAHLDPLETLLKLQTDQAHLLQDTQSLQVRLYLYPLMDLTKRQDIQLNVHHEMTPFQIEAFDRSTEPVIARLLGRA